MTGLLVLIGIGFLVYLKQLDVGLGITGMSRDVSWGFYIANFTFLVGVAAGGVMVVLPYYLHDYKAFGRITILGEFLAIASVVMCVTFILVDLGQPMRIFNVFLYLSPDRSCFWDTMVLNGYLFLNLDHRLECAGSRTQRGALSILAKTAYLSFDSLGRQYPYRHRLSVLRAARTGILADRHSGTALSGLGLCGRSGPSDPFVHDCS